MRYKTPLGDMTFPDDWPKEKVAARIKEILAASQKNQTKDTARKIESMPAFDRFATGATNSMLSTAEGAKQLTGLGTPNADSIDRIRAGNEVSDPAYLGGYIAGEIGQTAIPVLGAGAKTVPAMVAADAIANSAEQGAKYVDTPNSSEELHQRALNAALGGGASLLGSAVVAGGAKAINGMGNALRPSPEAAQIMQSPIPGSGIPGPTLTPGQAFSGSAHRFEDAARGTPVINQQIIEAQQDGIKQWNRKLFQQNAPSIGAAKSITESGHAGLKQLREAYSQAYDDAIAKFRPEPYDPTVGQLGRSWEPTSVFRDHGSLTHSDAADFDKLVQWAQSEVNRPDPASPLTYNMIQRVTQRISKEQAKAAKNSNHTLADAYGDLKHRVQSGIAEDLGQDTISGEIQLINQGYARYKVLEKASENAAQRSGNITPNGLIEADRANARKMGPGKYATGDGMFQNEAQAAQKVLGPTIPEMGPGTAEKAILGGAAVGAAADPITAAMATAGLWGAGKLYRKAGGAIARGLPEFELNPGTIGTFGGAQVGNIADRLVNDPSVPPGTISGYALSTNIQNDKPGTNPDDGSNWLGSGLGGAVGGYDVPTNEQGGTEPRLPEDMRKYLWSSMSDTEKATHRKNSVLQTLDNLSQQFGSAAPVASLAALGNTLGKHHKGDPETVIQQALFEAGVQTVDPARVRMVLEADQDSELGKKVSILVNAIGKYHPGDRMRQIATEKLAAIVSGTDYEFK